MILPEKDRLSITKIKLEADLSVAAGGRIAEEMIFGSDKVTTGASSDINQVTKIAKMMVIEWGMSEKLGFLSYAGEGAQEVFLGHAASTAKNMSNITAQIIDEEIRAIVDRTYKRAEDILKNNVKALELLAEGLLEHETLSGEDIKKIVDGKKLEKQKKAKIVRNSKKVKMPTSEDIKNAEKQVSSKREKKNAEEIMIDVFAFYERYY
jgi:cell division protease FtsH